MKRIKKERIVYLGKSGSGMDKAGGLLSAEWFRHLGIIKCKIKY